MQIPEHLLATAARHLRDGLRASLVVRHAERHPIVELRRHAELLLTTEGHAQAHRAGASLARLAPRVRLLHSPVERCAQTARALAAGAREAGCDATVDGQVPELAYPFVLDPDRAWPLVEDLGFGFIRHWFDGRVPTDIFDEPARAARNQLDAIARALRAEDVALTVFVSHDWNIALLREDALGVRPEDGWPAFLDGVAVSLDADGDPAALVVELAARSTRRPTMSPR